MLNFLSSPVFAFILLLTISYSRGFQRLSLSARETFLSCQASQMTSGFIPRCQADLEEILLGEASEKLRQGVPVEESMVKYAKTLEILPFQYSVNGYSGDLFQDYIKPYFVDNYLKVRLGDTFSTRGGNWAPQFKVVAIEGYAKQEGEYYIVGPDTQIECRRGVVKMDEGFNYESQLKGGNARPFHVNTISDIHLDIRKNDMSNKLNSLNYNNNIKQKNKSKFYKSKELMEDYESKLKEWIKLENRDFHNYLKRKYVDCDNLKDLLIATNSIENIVDNLSSVESEIESSIIIDSFINLYKKSFIASMDEKGISPDAAYSLFFSFAEEAITYTKTVTINAMEVELGKKMTKESSNTKKYLLDKYSNYKNVANFLENIGTSSTDIENLSDKELNISIDSIIEAFTQIHKVSFIDRMEEMGISFSVSISIFFHFQADMQNIRSNDNRFAALFRPIKKGGGWRLFKPKTGRRWPGPLTMIKSVLKSVVSLINRSKRNRIGSTQNNFDI